MENSVIDEEKLTIIPIFPIGDGDIDFDAIDCSPDGPDVNVVDDEELVLSGTKPTIEMVGRESKITFYTDSWMNYLVCHVKTSGKFFHLTIILRDSTDVDRIFHFSNSRTIVIVDNNTAHIPLSVATRGWQRLCFDFEHLLKHAFGTSFQTCFEVIITGSCRVSCVYFQSRIHSDPELPGFLRVLCQK